MKLIAVNASPRKNWNTHVLLTKAMEGAQRAGAQTQLYNLYDLAYKGCTGCLACKLKNAESLGRCVVNDGLKPVLDAIDECDALILGSPIYLGDLTAMMKVFLERLIFQYLSYDDYSQTYYKGNIGNTALICTMNMSEHYFEQAGMTALLAKYQTMLGRFGQFQSLACTETLQVDDYSKYHMASFHEADRIKRRNEVFPADCEKAFRLGLELCQIK